MIARFLMLYFFIVFISGCSSDVAEEKDDVDKPVQKGGASQLFKYQFSESFNVGKNVYVRALTTDKEQKNLWVGTSLGALQIEVASGNIVKTFTRDNALANEYVFTANVNARGDVWLGTNGGGVSRLQAGEWKTYFPMHGLGDYWVYSFADQKDEAMWIGTWDGLSRFDYKTETFKTYVKELVNEWVYGLAVDSKKRLWIGTEGGVNRFDGHEWKVWTHKDGLGAPNLKNLPFSINTGLGTRNRHDLGVITQGSESYNPNYIFCVKVAKNDTVWVGTWGGGVSFYNGIEWQNLTSKDGLAGNIVYSVEIAEDGSYWFGTNNGLSHYDGKTWQNFSTPDGLLDRHVYAIVESANNDIWVGTRHGVAVFKKVDVN